MFGWSLPPFFLFSFCNKCTKTLNLQIIANVRRRTTCHLESSVHHSKRKVTEEATEENATRTRRARPKCKTKCKCNEQQLE
uniref:Putative secreted protein n=1 Tax=Anopheles marajoara TaxID=58244 RepID=A0A2M4CBK7_9DIPT